MPLTACAFAAVRNVPEVCDAVVVREGRERSAIGGGDGSGKELWMSMPEIEKRDV